MTTFGSQFAMKGGGHTPIEYINNINSSGVLLSSTALKTLALSLDGKTVSVGPGNRWGDVYSYLEPYELNVVGGRLGIVGVPGLIMGGGMSFLSWEHGFASSNIASLTVSTVQNVEAGTILMLSTGCPRQRYHRRCIAQQ